MEIKDVEFIPGHDVGGGLYQEAQFLVTWEAGNKNYIPLAPTNRHYIEVQQWYEKQKSPPFEFDFNNPEG